jgi:DNA invertase Pin-like site-specific DNA recombinase
LPKEYKVPFSMHVSGFKYREIAEKMSLSRQYVNRIKKEILIATHTKML